MEIYDFFMKFNFLTMFILFFYQIYYLINLGLRKYQNMKFKIKEILTYEDISFNLLLNLLILFLSGFTLLIFLSNITDEIIYSNILMIVITFGGFNIFFLIFNIYMLFVFLSTKE